MHKSMTWSLLISLATAMLLTAGLVAEADARGQRAQGHARANVNRAPAPHAQRAQRINAPQRANHVNAGNRVNSGNRVNAGNNVGNRTYVNNSNRNVNRNVNIDNHRDVDIDVDGHGRYGYDDHYHPIATAAAVTATVAVTAAVVGSIFTPAQMPSSCVQVIRYNVAYMQCGSTWYQPQYQGSDVTYVVVNAP
ncbi:MULTISPECIES: hypothetical protein [Pseudomonas]|uniref:Uncharacterized protein n=1 Tax=Pseudomonas fluorescens TaxID=294 RepID=A0A5E7LUR5_PSEFL|nr:MULTISPECIES: hypothetical protein [Pseudomonas]KPG96150.1 hypothetical protein AK821_12555 [Pseudomonas sp. RIT-PI-r]MCP1488247.1 hypothetical protein [Pseudomonas fluorescens]VVP17231.1 hypothetical protein PS896_03647 [Pseudomonas fluorescens]